MRKIQIMMSDALWSRKGYFRTVCRFFHEDGRCRHGHMQKRWLRHAIYSRIGKEPSSRVECPQINLQRREIRNVSGVCFVLFKLAINNDKYRPMEHPAVCAHHRSANATETKVSDGPNLPSARDFDTFRYACVPVAHGPIGDFRHRALDPDFCEPTASSEPNDL